MLKDLLVHNGEYALALGPGFFCFYAHCGILCALEEMGLFAPTHISGSSAGALIGSLISCGLRPSQIVPKILRMKREDCWDAGESLFGLLKGDLFKKELAKNFPNGIRRFEDLKIPFAVSVWELLHFRTKIISNGDLANAVVGACCVPLLFAPTIIDGTPCVDGGFFDEAGIMGLSGVPESKLVVNIVCSGQAVASSFVPTHLGNDCRLLTMVMENIPDVNPFTMGERGPIAFETARLATLNAFSNGHLQQLHQKHWVTYIDGLRVQNENLQAALLRQELLFANTENESWQDDIVNRHAVAPSFEKLKEPPQIRPFHFLEEAFKHARKRRLSHTNHHHQQQQVQQSSDKKTPQTPFSVSDKFSPIVSVQKNHVKDDDNDDDDDNVSDEKDSVENVRKRRKSKDQKSLVLLDQVENMREKRTFSRKLSSSSSTPQKTESISTTRVTRSSAVKKSKSHRH